MSLTSDLLGHRLPSQDVLPSFSVPESPSPVLLRRLLPIGASPQRRQQEVAEHWAYCCARSQEALSKVGAHLGRAGEKLGPMHLKRKPVQSSPDELAFVIESKCNSRQKVKVKANTKNLTF